MQTLRLARIAAEAEKLRWQRRAKRLAMRAVFGAVAAFFALASLVVLHVLAFAALRLEFSPLVSTAIVLAFDIVLTAIFGFVASRGGPDPVELEAVEVRQNAVAQMTESLTMFAMLRPLGRMLGKRSLYGMTLAALTARFLSK